MWCHLGNDIATQQSKVIIDWKQSLQPKIAGYPVGYHFLISRELSKGKYINEKLGLGGQNLLYHILKVYYTKKN